MDFCIQISNLLYLLQVRNLGNALSTVHVSFILTIEDENKDYYSAFGFIVLSISGSKYTKCIYQL